jgi:bifunctional UDP-N-acetylglucosamine pyrophosphorylase/glucosamine-1-phosphate N-acetyltransferase
VFCGKNDEFKSIIEHRDCTPEQRQNARINAGIYCFDWPKLEQVLPTLTTNNDQAEYYITDAVNYLSPVTAMDVADYQEIFGINDRVQLANAYSILQTRKREELMRAGVLLIDPASVTIDDGVSVGAETVIEPQTHLRGNTMIGTNCRLGPGSLIEDSTIGDGVTVMYSVVSDSTIANDTRVGPFAHLRGHADIGTGCRIGNFVEVKQSTIGDRTNAAHLAYLGNATLGERVNVGAGTITANYDGVNKHPTTIGAGSKTGANSVLVAPITIGENVTIAAGSTITKDVEDDSLAIGRARQVSRKGWKLQTSPRQTSPDTSDPAS